MKKCQECGTELPLEAKFCFNCGAPQPEVRVQEQVVLEPGADLTQRIIDQFFPALRTRIKGALSVLYSVFDTLVVTGFKV